MIPDPPIVPEKSSDTQNLVSSTSNKTFVCENGGDTTDCYGK